jgi:hypothetical protein
MVPDNPSIIQARNVMDKKIVSIDGMAIAKGGCCHNAS